MPVEITNLQQLQALINSPKVTVVDFYATWCGPCKMVAPEYDRMSQYYDGNKATFCKVDVDRAGDCAQRFNVTAMPTFMVFRQGQAIETIRGANMTRLQQVIDAAVAQVPSSFSSPGHALGGGSGRSTLLDSASAVPSATPVHPLMNSMCTLQSAISTSDPIAKKDACDAVVRMLRSGGAPLGVSTLVPYLMSSSYNPLCLAAVLEYYQTMGGNELEEGTFIVWSLAQFFVNAFTAQSWSSSTSAAPLHKAFLNLVRCPAARTCLVTSNRFMCPTTTTGDALERQSLLGSMIGVGLSSARSTSMNMPVVARQQRMMTLLQSFPLTGDGSELDKVVRDRTTSDMQTQLEGFSALCFPVFRELLGDKDVSRQPTLQWISKILEANRDYTKTMMDNSRVSSSTTMMELTSVMIDLALPVVATPSFDPSSIPVFYTYDPKAIMSFGSDVERVAHFDSEHPLPTLPEDEAARSYLPRVHLFFAALRAVELTYTSMLLRYDTYSRNARYPGMRAQERHYYLAECAMTQAMLGGATLALKVVRFLNGVARWLLHAMGAKPDGTLPTTVPEGWKTLPQTIIDSVIRGTKLITSLRVTVPATEMHDILSLTLVLMGNATFFPKPHTHALFPPLLISLLQEREGSDALQRHPWFQEHIVRGCISCYIAMEKSEYEKVQTRYELSHCLRAFLRNASLCLPVKQEFDAGASSVLERFSHMVTADVNAAVDAIVQTLQKMNAMVTSGVDLSAPPQSSSSNNEEEEDDGNGNGGAASSSSSASRQRSYEELGQELQSNLMLFDVSVDVFMEMTVQFPHGVAQNLVTQQISQMLARSITCFAGPKCRDLVIKNAEKYSFQPRQVLTKLVECLVQFQDSESFLKHLCECGVPLQEIYDAMGSVVHRRLVREDLTARLTAMYNRILGVAKQVEDDVKLWDDAPDYALDVLLSTPLTDPVAIPTEVKDMDDLFFTNRATLHHALLTEPKNPYTKEYLDESMVDAFNARPDVAAAIVDLKRRISEWVANARQR